MFNSENIESVTLTEDGRLEVVERASSGVMYLTDPPRPAPDRVWKEVYAADQVGRIFLLETINGVVTPAVPERVEFNR